VYTPDLATRIVNELEAEDDDTVVLKLCNRSRAAGIVIVPVNELDEVLEELLVLPSNLEGWFRTQLSTIESGSAANFGINWGSFEEQMRHWWANESPSFVVERWCTSMPTLKEGMAFDGTMRVGFALRRRQRKAEPHEETAEVGQQSPTKSPSQAKGTTLPAEDLEVEWLGGYWKLPKRDMDCDLLRERVVSAARVSGTAPVCPAQLFEVYAALGDSVQQLFGGSVPSPQILADRYAECPELAAYLSTRVAVALRDKDGQKLRKMMYDVQVLISKLPEGPGRNVAESFLYRAHGVVEAKGKLADRWQNARRHFTRSLELFPTNANSLFLLGTSMLEAGKAQQSVAFMNKSLLLDPDFKAPYVNLGVAYLRLGMYERAVEISEACLARHPQSPQCHYHIGAACSQQALVLEARQSAGKVLSNFEVMEYEELHTRAVESFCEARDSDEGQKRKPAAQASGTESPWLPEDDQMFNAMKTASSRTSLTRPSAMWKATLVIQLPPTVGWRVFGWRL